MENWKDIVEEEDYASRTRLVLLFLMDLEASPPNVMLEFHIIGQRHKYLLGA
jgi:hypothetical protein